MSTMMRSDRKPPLASRSPIRLRPRRSPLQSTQNTLQTISVKSTTSRVPKKPSNSEELELRPEYHTISCELRELTKMVQDNLKGSTSTNEPASSSNENPLFQRGKFYEEYSAIRNERLKRKRGETEIENKTPCKQNLGVKNESTFYESTKKSTEVKKFESGRKMTTPMVERGQVATAQRYSLRSSCKENKKPPVAVSFERSVMEKKTTVRRTARKGY